MPRRRSVPRQRRPGGIDYRYRLQKAEGFLKAANACHAVGEWDSCVSRAYYAAYHMVAAVIEAKAGFTRRPWEHKTLLEDYRQYFTQVGFLFSALDAEDFESLMSLRFEADYRDPRFNEKTVERALEKAKRLCGKIKEVLSEEDT